MNLVVNNKINETPSESAKDTYMLFPILFILYLNGQKLQLFGENRD
jgi:hypothetical protein